ncbi:uncharacterized protein BO87DRAFT_216869 [Aspergillus neoniger CBS 115656]|uniref:Uncharacterized protein n=1 Tax=Aspergillus neoniger (strain CBS 115656) TaxID=1448310 RepID=A0A318YSI6_ASPNB|nr:hypothetical protein BO87DRAFT_216869 [Aspergillus neoniger CBS 115656]PYH36907.1 hypothetical protein BO87DRAFT_216869 [Aspergillus neoniger CBS 115656]
MRWSMTLGGPGHGHTHHLSQGQMGIRHQSTVSRHSHDDLSSTQKSLRESLKPRLKLQGLEIHRTTHHFPLHITPWHIRIVPSWLILAAWGITGIPYVLIPLWI